MIINAINIIVQLLRIDVVSPQATTIAQRRGHEAVYAILGCIFWQMKTTKSMPVSRTSLRFRAYYSAFDLINLLHLFRWRSNNSLNAAAEISLYSGTFAIVFYFWIWRDLQRLSQPIIIMVSNAQDPATSKAQTYANETGPGVDRHRQQLYQ